MKRSDANLIGISEGHGREHVAEALSEDTKGRDPPYIMVQINP